MSGKCGGLHCPGCGDGGLGALAVIVIVVCICAAIAKPVEHAAIDVLHVLEIAGMVTGGLLVTGAAIWAAVALHRHRQGLPRTARASLVAPVLPEAVHGRSEPHAIDGPREVHLHLHGVTADDLAAITRQLGTPGHQ